VDSADNDFAGVRRKSVLLAFVSFVAMFMFASVCLNLWSMVEEVRTLSRIYAGAGHTLGYQFLLPVAISVVLGVLFFWVAQHVWRKQSFFAAKIFLALLSLYSLVVTAFSWYGSEPVLSDAIWTIVVIALLAWVVFADQRAKRFSNKT
jgi:hypothetical protein